MIKFNMLALLLIHSFAHAGSTLLCEASGKIDGIKKIHAEDSYPANEKCAVLNEGTKNEIIHCSKGSITDSVIELSSNFVLANGTTSVVIEKTESKLTTTYTMKKIFECDWVNNEEQCSPGTPAQLLSSEVIDCNLIRD